MMGLIKYSNFLFILFFQEKVKSFKKYLLYPHVINFTLILKTKKQIKFN